MDPVADFMNITGVDSKTASFYLEMHNHDVEAATEFFFANSGPAQQQSPPKPQVPQQQPQTKKQAPPSTIPSGSSAGTAKKTGFQDLASFLSQSKDEDEDDEDEEDGKNDKNTYYAGGSQTSGELIIGPKDHKKARTPLKSGDELMKNLLDMAKEQKEPKPAEQEERAKPFKGSGKSLGSLPSTAFEPARNQKGILKPEPEEEEEEERKMKLTAYSDGFTIDDGEFRPYSDPNNQKLLKSFKDGYVPAEIAGKSKNISLEMEEKNEKYTPPPMVFKAFAGEGKSMVSHQEKSKSGPSLLKTAPKRSFEFDETKPGTVVVVKMADGTQLKVKINLDHTIQDLKDFVALAKPIKQDFDLIVPFPRKVLNDMYSTVGSAGIANSVIVQTMK